MAITAMPAPLSAILVKQRAIALKCGISGSSLINLSSSILSLSSSNEVTLFAFLRIETLKGYLKLRTGKRRMSR